MKKVLFLVPHLSTGGMPQYTYDLMRKIKDEVEVYCIEYSMISWDFVVQRNRIIELLGDKFFSLGSDKDELISIIDKIKPDIIHLQDIPEYFLDGSIANKLYLPDRKYLIVETSHDSSFSISNKRFYPDHFALITKFQKNEFSKLGIPIDIVESDIEIKDRQDRVVGLTKLGLDPNLKHVLNIGLFTPRKNQAEAIEYARSLEGQPIQFHFVGNQADNFKHYWEPLLQNLPSNVKIWGERSDVDSFYSCMDLMIFTSRGTQNDKETSPLVIREAIGYNIPSLIYNLPVYTGMYDKYENISYLDEVSFVNNIEKILEKLSISHLRSPDSCCIVISTYTNTKDVLDKTIRCIQNAKKNIGSFVICCNHYDDTFFNDSIKSASDEYVLDTNNILTKNSFYKVYNESIEDYDIHLHLDKSNNDTYHGAAVYQNYYNGVRKAKQLGYKYAALTNFDMNFSDVDCLNIKKIMNLLVDNDMNGFFLFQNEQEGPTFKTVFCIVNIETFMEVFPEIKNEKDYNDLVNRFGSETNNLENLFYHALKNVDKIMVEEKHESKFFTSNECFTNSQVDYFSVLPIQDGKFGIYIKKSNDGNVNQKIKVIGTKNDVAFLSESFDISNSFSKVIEVDLETDTSYNFVLIQTDDLTLNRKTLVINDLNLVRQNGYIRRRS